MAQSQFRSVRKVSGKKYTNVRKKRQCDLGGVPAHTQIGSKKEKVKRVLGGNEKKSLLRAEIVLVNEGDKVTKLTIDGVTENPANIHYTRRNVITKGAIVKTAKGEVMITSRPGQSGSLFGKFVK
jgi:small subunit ribosomal protein S8e